MEANGKGRMTKTHVHTGTKSAKNTVDAASTLTAFALKASFVERSPY